MSKFNQEKFNNFIVDNDTVGFFAEPITLKSGRISNWYANMRNITEDVFSADRLSDFIIDFSKENIKEFDCFYGVPEGATKTGVITQYKWAKSQPNFGKGSHVLTMGRKKPKDHGAPKDKYFVGAPTGKVIVIEDVTTTGGSLIENLEFLKNAGIDVVCALALFNRMERRDDGKSVEDKVTELGVQYIAMSNALEILPLVARKVKPSPETLEATKKYFSQYGLKELNF